MRSIPTVKLSLRRASVQVALAIALLWLGSSALAAPIPANGLILPPEASQQSGLTQDVGAPSIIFAKKNGKAGGGGSGNAGQGDDKDKDDKDDKDDKKDDQKDEGGDKDKKDRGGDKDKKDQGGKKDKKDKKDRKDEDGKKDQKDEGGKKDQKDQGGKKDQKDEDGKKDQKDQDGKKDQKDEDGKKDRKDEGRNKDQKDQGGKKDQKDEDGKKDKKDEDGKKDQKDEDGKKDQKDEGGEKDQKDQGRKKDQKDEDGKKDRKDEDGKKDQKDEDGKKDKKDEDGKKDKKDEDGKKDKDDGDSGERDDPDDDPHDHDRNERHDHENGEADDRHDHETEEEQHGHHGNEESGEDVAEQGEERERDAGEDASSVAVEDDTAASDKDTSNAEPDEEAPTGETESAAGTVPGVVTLSWMPPTENEDGSPLLDLAGYRIYWNDTAGACTGSMKIENPGLSTAVIENLAAGTYEFAMSSVNAAGIESARSNAITRVVEFGVEPVATAENEATTGSGPYLMISGAPSEAVTAGDLYLFTPGLESSGEDPPFFMIEGLPHWAGFNEINGELYGAPAEEDIGLYEAITILATDGVVDTSLPTFSIEVIAPGAAAGAVTLSWMPPTENADGSYLVDLAGYWIYWGNNPGQYTEWLRIDNPGLTMVVIEDLVPGDWEFAMTSFNASGVESGLSNAVTRFVE